MLSDYPWRRLRAGRRPRRRQLTYLVLLHYIDSAKKNCIRRVCCASDPKGQMARVNAEMQRKGFLAAYDFGGAPQRSYTRLRHRSPRIESPVRVRERGISLR